MVNVSSTNSTSFDTNILNFPENTFSIDFAVTVAARNIYGEGPQSEPGTMMIIGMYVCIVYSLYQSF